MLLSGAHGWHLGLRPSSAHPALVSSVYVCGDKEPLGTICMDGYVHMCTLMWVHIDLEGWRLCMWVCLCVYFLDSRERGKEDESPE